MEPKLKTEYIEIVNQHHEIAMRNRKAREYCQSVREPRIEDFANGTALFLFMFAVLLLATALIFGGTV